MVEYKQALVPASPSDRFYSGEDMGLATSVCNKLFAENQKLIGRNNTLQRQIDDLHEENDQLQKKIDAASKCEREQDAANRILSKINEERASAYNREALNFENFDVFEHGIDRTLWVQRYNAADPGIAKQLTRCNHFEVKILPDQGGGSDLIVVSYIKEDGDNREFILPRKYFNPKHLFESFSSSGGSFSFGKQMNIASYYFHSYISKKIPSIEPQPLGWVYETGGMQYYFEQEDGSERAILSSDDMDSSEMLFMSLVRLYAFVQDLLPEGMTFNKPFWGLNSSASQVCTASLDDLPKDFNQRISKIRNGLVFIDSGFSSTNKKLGYRQMQNLASLLAASKAEGSKNTFVVLGSAQLAGTQKEFIPFFFQEEQPKGSPIVTYGGAAEIIKQHPEDFHIKYQAGFNSVLHQLDTDYPARKEAAVLGGLTNVISWVINTLDAAKWAEIQGAFDVCATRYQNFWDEAKVPVETVFCGAMRKGKEDQFFEAVDREDLLEFEPERMMITDYDAFFISKALIDQIIMRYMPGFLAPDVIKSLKNKGILIGPQKLNLTLEPGDYLERRVYRLRPDALEVVGGIPFLEL